MTESAFDLPRPFGQRLGDARMRLGLVVLTGGALGVAAGGVYYDDQWYPLAHMLGPWAAGALLLAIGRSPRIALIRSVAFLVAAVTTFFLTVKVFYDLRWAARGSTLPVDWERLSLWLVLALVGGCVLGALATSCVRQDWRGVAAGGASVGVVAGEALQRALEIHGVDQFVGLDLLLAAIVLRLFLRSHAFQKPVAGAVMVATIASALLLSVPDLAESIFVYHS